MKSLKRLAFCAILPMLLPMFSACAHNSEPAIRTVEIRVPVAIPCTATPPAEPDFADTDDALRDAPSHVERVRLLVIGRLQRVAHDQELHAYASACAG